MIKVIIADDQELIRQSLQIILSMNENIEVVGCAENGIKVLELMEKTPADVILMDIRMPIMDGVYCTKEIKKLYPNTKVIILTTFDDDDFVFSALKYGASGYLLKGVSMDELAKAIKTVYDGGAMINPDIATKVVGQFSRMNDDKQTIEVFEEGIKDIGKTEWKVIQQISYGKTNKEIAQTLFLSEGTVRNYLSSILSKLYLRDRTQLAIWAIQTNYMKEALKNE